MALRPEDMNAVIPDGSKTKSLVQRGFRNIHEMRDRGGERVERSEKFLRRLMRATQKDVEVSSLDFITCVH